MDPCGRDKKQVVVVNCHSGQQADGINGIAWWWILMQKCPKRTPASGSPQQKCEWENVLAS